MQTIMKESATEKAVSEFLKSIGTIHSVRFVGADNRDGWECDSWAVTIYPADNIKRRNGAEIVTQYHTGTGSRSKQGRPQTPHIAGILYSLLLDASLGDDTFCDFCANCGYDDDSRKALAIYLQCQKTGEQMRKVFSSTEREHLSFLLQDY
jgi:hypothetical protein